MTSQDTTSILRNVVSCYVSYRKYIYFKIVYIDLREKGGRVGERSGEREEEKEGGRRGKREREKHKFVVPLIFTYIG